jgi:putative toxin-antitoxin system antitoxin component (TIGR02293 family)
MAKRARKSVSGKILGRPKHFKEGRIHGHRAGKGSIPTDKLYVDMSQTGKILAVETDGAGGATVQLIKAVNAGFPYEFLDKLSGSTGLTVDTIADTVLIPPRTLSRRKVERRLQPDESERLLRVSNLVSKTVDLFEGDRAAAMNWLQRPQKGLGDGVPLEFAKTEIGARAVEDLIGRLEHGVFS